MPLRSFPWLVIFLVGCPAATTMPDDASGADGGAVRDGGADAGTCLCTSATDCDDGVYCNGPEACTSCTCIHGTAPCAAPSCHESTHSCDCTTPDADGDGSRSTACGGTDCDDADPNRFPGHPEVCDVASTDEDCDPTTFGFRDADGDGVADAACCNHAGVDHCGTDCNDVAPGVNPTAPEVCNGMDDDCDGAIDETVLVTACADCDGDGHGVPAGTTTTACGRAPSMIGCSTPMHYATTCDDCNDGNVDIYGMHPELCDGVDNDCNGMVDDGVSPQVWYVDCDGDGVAAAGATMMTSCTHPTTVPTCVAPGGTCMPTLVPSWTLSAPTGANIDCDDFHTSARPGAAEACDGLDTDCNGSLSATEDADHDGFARAACAPCGTDCDDSNPAIHPGAVEVVADGVDGNCDGQELCHPDADGDHYGGATTVAVPVGGDVHCTASGHAALADDCCDMDGAAHPGATPFWTTMTGCGNYDYNCNGTGEPIHPAAPCGDCDPTTCTLISQGWWCSQPTAVCGATRLYLMGCMMTGPGLCQRLGTSGPVACH